MRTAIVAALLMVALPSCAPVAREGALPLAPGADPIVRDKFTADPAPLVVGDRLYLYVGHDEAERDQMFNMRE